MRHARTALNRWTRWTAALALAAAACGGDDDDGTTAPTPTIGVTLASPTLSVVAGQSGTVAATVARGGGYTGAVNLTVEGAPSTITATANPASLAGGVTASTVTVTTGSATPAGTYNLTVRAAGTGAVAAVTAPLAVTVTAPAPAAGFTVALAAPTLTVTQGAAATSATLNITRTGGFAGAVTVTASGAPAGLTVTPAAATTGNSVAISVQAAPTVAPGTYAIALSAAGAGITAPQTTTLNVTVQAAVAPDFSLANSTVTVAQGAAAQTATVNITRTGGFAGEVTLTTTGTVPAGLTVTPAAASTGNSIGVQVQAAPSVAPGSYTVNLAATGAGVTGTKAATLTVTVTPAVTVGGYTLGTTGNVTVQQGASGTTTLNVTRTGGFAGAVQVAATGAPNGVTVTVTPNPVTAGTATVNVAATAGATTGTATVTLTGTSAGVPNQTTTFTVNVTAASTGGGNDVGLSFCAAEAPLWVGFQSEGGAWQRATLGANNVARVNITGARGAVAYVVQGGTGAAASYQTTVVYGTATELNGYGTNLCTNVVGGKSVTGTVAGVGATDQAAITLGDATANITGSNFRIDDVQPGPRDLLAVRSSIDLATFSIAPNRVILRRNQNIPNGGTIPVLDFGSAEAFAPASARITVGGLGANEVGIPFVALQTANGASAPFFTGFAAVLTGGTGPQTYYGLPTDRLAAGDLHQATAIGFTRNGQNIDASVGRIVTQYFRTVADRTVTLGPVLNAPTVSSSNSPYPRPRVQLARQAQYGDGFAATFSQASAPTRSVAMVALASYLQGGSTWDLTFPDFTGAPGFDATWMLRSGVATDWQVIASGGQGITQLGQIPTEGQSFAAAFRSGTLTTSVRALGFAVRQPLAVRATVDGVRQQSRRAAELAERALRARR